MVGYLYKRRVIPKSRKDRGCSSANCADTLKINKFSTAVKRTNSYSISIKSEEHTKQIEFQNSERFKERAKERYKIEAENSELKYRHGCEVASSSSLEGMRIQGAMAIFTVNIKQIINIMTLLEAIVFQWPRLVRGSFYT